MHNLVRADGGCALLGCSEKPCTLILGVPASNLLRISCQRFGTSVDGFRHIGALNNAAVGWG